ncbi:extracellular solute-binding protein [Cohnella nanjingensis]|uniref:Extracellular solute-binding protein n=1 Tax=Cohnella nanjingensis TaxID=1387779 RepID=A0A7X0RUI7_9BACL|nr:extracellular solute-binding protein [Cohnella nanjingensis]MBB6673798.1 extracellular solute-binding protein [Cohnella nanjingensis]
MKNRKKGLLAIALVLSIVLVAACNGNKNNDSSGNAAPASTAGTEATQTAEASQSAAPEEIDPLGKYAAPIEISTARSMTGSMKFPAGDTIDNNVWSRAYLDDLGIKVKNDWTADESTFEQKMNVSIASGNIPDLVPVKAVQLKQLVDANMVEDLTDVWNKYASPLTKQIFTYEGNITLDSATFNGKLMAIPAVSGSFDASTLLWVRSDWLKKLNLPEPKTIDDVVKIADAFTNQDPDGNGKKDTIGLELQKELYERNTGYAGIDGLMFGYHAYPRFWIKDASGNLVNGSIQPEVKAALLKLQEMYKAGLIDKEFGSKDTNKAAEAQGAGKNGLHYGHMWNPLFPLNASRDNDPKAEWTAYPIVSVDDQPARPGITQSINDFTAVKKGYAHPEAAIKMLNLFVNISNDNNLETSQKYGKTPDGIEVFKFAVLRAGLPNGNLNMHLSVTNALKTKDTSKLTLAQKDTYDQITKYLSGSGTTAEWSMDRIYGETGSFRAMNEYATKKLDIYNEFYGTPTKTMAAKQSTLDKMEYEVFTKIIMGDSIDNFDKFVSDWKKIGGDEITKEVNEWYKNK